MAVPAPRHSAIGQRSVQPMPAADTTRMSRLTETDAGVLPLVAQPAARGRGARSISRAAPLRVLIVSRHPDMPGGVARSTALMRRRLSGRIRADSFVIGRRPAERGLHQTIWRVVADYWRFIVLLLRRRYDVVHLNPSLVPKSLVREGILLAMLRLACQRRIFVFLRGWDWAVARRLAANPLYLGIFRFLFGRVTRIAVMSTTFRDALVAMGIDAARIVIVPSMFDGPELARTKAEEDPVKQRAMILFLSRFVAGKGMHETIEGFARIAVKYPEAHLVMAGDGEQRRALEQQVRELGLAGRVRFPGYVQGRDKARLLLAADIFVLPSTYNEGLPNALLEAMAAGAAVITSEAGGIPEVVHAPENGIVLQEISATTIGGAMEQLLARPSNVALMGAENAATAWAQFESTVVTRRIEAIYAAVAAGTPVA